MNVLLGCVNAGACVWACSIFLVHTKKVNTQTHPDIAALVDPLFGFAGKKV
jgi:hypothetical protein